MDQNKTTEFLTSLPLFKRCDKGTLTRVLGTCRCDTVDTPQGGEIVTDTPSLGILLEGRAQIRSTDKEGVILRTLKKGDVFGAASLFLQDAAPLSQIIARTPCTTLLLSRTAVCELMQRDGAFLDEYLAFLAGRVHFLNQKIRCYTAGSAERRLALWIAAEGKDTITLPGSLSALAKTLDIGRASLYRALDKLEETELITRNGRTITVPCVDTLLEIYQ